MLKKSNQKGFSIIEVLIVLAIAGLIMLVVFLAVPALQRNARNQARQSDASKFSAAVSQCLSNNNGQTTKCKNIYSATNKGGVQFTASDYGQLTVAPRPASAAPFNSATETALSQNATFNDTGNWSVGTATNRLAWAFMYRCDGSIPVATANSRDFVVVYRTEGTGSPFACIGS